MQIRILGKGCPKCKALEERVRKVAADNSIEIDLIKVTEIEEIMSYGVMMTPGLVVDGEVRSSGKLPDEKQILEWIR
ncbi:MAG TPA: thioredoxin family protein [bacterium]|nr:thioredoxin family protein [bacterium]HNT66817.1 thioredoxin family protein [bacterium]HOX87593.1 thioredoxin family protein [bacterium]HPG47105.1 thioredoxin family protein [bacterium]HPM99571.1 thioredoxin family protein [bacterium]